MKIINKKIEETDIDNLKPHPENPRHGQIASISNSIKINGFYGAIVAQKSTGYVLAGNHRLKAAKECGIEKIPVAWVDCTDEEAKRILLADNRLSDLAEYDNDALVNILKELAESDLGLDGTGYDDSFLESIVDDIEGQCDPDEIPEILEEPTTKLGDIWILGKHRVMCGDSTSINDLELLMNGEKAALLHADPPYGMGKQKDGVLNDNLYDENLDKFQMEWWATYRTFLVDNASVYIWGNPADLWRLWYLGGLQESEKLTFRNEVVWEKKTTQGMGGELFRLYPPVTERALFFVLGEQGFNNNVDNYWEEYEPIRSYLENEMKKAGWNRKDLDRITGTHMAQHWITKSQWQLITEEYYIKIQKAACKHDAFKREYDALKREYDAIKRDFNATRAYFDNTHDIMTDVWEFERVTGNDRHGHATPKPVAMMERVMKSSLPVSGLCVEPFGGSGSTLMGAEKTNRICYTMELQPQYVDVIVKRWEKFTGKKAIHEKTSKTFEQLKN
jgi:DNA modification methylase